MPISSFSNPIPDIISGLLQGHQLAQQMHLAKQADQKFKTDQVLAQQKVDQNNQLMSVQDIMNQQMLGQNARPVSDMGTVSNPAGPSISTGVPIPGMDTQPGAPAYQRKADASRTVKYGGRSYELKTPEEQQQQAADLEDAANERKATGAQSLQTAKLRAAQDEEDRVLKLTGVEVPADLAARLHIPPGRKVLPGKIEEMWKEAEGIRQKNQVKLTPGETLVDTSPQDAAPAPTPLTGAQQGAQDGRAMAGLPPQTPQGTQNPQPAAAGARVIASGAPAKQDDQQSYTQAWAEDHGTTLAKMTGAQKIQASTAYARRAQDPAAHADAQAAREEARAFREQSHQDLLNNQQQQKGEQSYRFHAGELDKEAKPVGDLESRVSRLNDTLSQNSPQADALVAPQLLSMLAGGQGSGLRINEAEIKRVVGGTSQWEALKTAANKWQLDPTKANSILPEQRKQIRDLVGMVNTRVQAKQQVLTDARTGLMNSNDPMEHRKILGNAKQQLGAIDTQSGGPKTGDTKAYGGRNYAFDGKEWVAK